RIDLASESDDQLIARLGSGNIYFRETAQRMLTERLGSAAVSAVPVGASPTESGRHSSELRSKLENLVLTPVAADVRRLTSKSESDQSLVTSAATTTQSKARLH